MFDAQHTAQCVGHTWHKMEEYQHKKGRELRYRALQIRRERLKKLRGLANLGVQGLTLACHLPHLPASFAPLAICTHPNMDPHHLASATQGALLRDKDNDTRSASRV